MIRAPSHCGWWIRRCSDARLTGMPACWSRMHSSAKILSMKRSSRVPLVSQCTISLSRCAATAPRVGASMFKTPGAVTGIDGTGICRIPGPWRQWSRQDGLPLRPARRAPRRWDARRRHPWRPAPTSSGEAPFARPEKASEFAASPPAVLQAESNPALALAAMRPISGPLSLLHAPAPGLAEIRRDLSAVGVFPDRSFRRALLAWRVPGPLADRRPLERRPVAAAVAAYRGDHPGLRRAHGAMEGDLRHPHLDRGQGSRRVDLHAL